MDCTASRTGWTVQVSGPVIAWKSFFKKSGLNLWELAENCWTSQTRSIPVVGQFYFFPKDHTKNCVVLWVKKKRGSWSVSFFGLAKERKSKETKQNKRAASPYPQKPSPSTHRTVHRHHCVTPATTPALRSLHNTCVVQPPQRPQRRPL